MLQWIEEWVRRPEVLPFAILVGSIVAAFVIEELLLRVFAPLVTKTETEVDDAIVAALRRPIFLTILFYGISWAATAGDLPPRAMFFVDGSLRTMAIWIWTITGFRVSFLVLQSMGGSANEGALVQPRTVPVFDMLVKIGIAGSAIYFTFLTWNIDVTAWLASAGIVGIAVGFAAKDTLANLFSGIFILADAPYKVGDWIVLDGGLRGTVTHIGVRSTRILTRADIEITVPNAVIGNSKIMNEAGGRHLKQRIGTKVSAAYGSDIDLVRETLLAVPATVDLVCTDPEPIVRFRAFGGSGLEFELMVWIEEHSRRGYILDGLNTAIYKAFAQAGIEIPYSKHDIYIKEMPQNRP